MFRDLGFQGFTAFLAFGASGSTSFMNLLIPLVRRCFVFLHSIYVYIYIYNYSSAYMTVLGECI